MARRSSSSVISSTGVPGSSVLDADADVTATDAGAVFAATAGAVRRRAGARAVTATSRALRVGLIREPASWVRESWRTAVAVPGTLSPQGRKITA
ncbi:hypothetical protein GCM10010451_03440 [Streptomyces virens]|uniref:Uncharacterized protein n=1 Tax=Streptomyces virens TaxID=285572 RepID=A0ABP6NV49_9ACTN